MRPISIQQEGEAEAMGISEAARKLGISERTVYRMLKTGKMKRVSIPDKNVSDVRVEGNRESYTQKVENDVMVAEKNTDIMTNILTEAIVEGLKEEIREKDVQIAKLLESQREMTQSVQKLQDQMFELARLVLSQNVLKPPPATPSESGESGKKGSKASSKSSWLSFFRPPSRGNDTNSR